MSTPASVQPLMAPRTSTYRLTIAVPNSWTEEAWMVHSSGSRKERIARALPMSADRMVASCWYLVPYSTDCVFCDAESGSRVR